MKVKMVAVLGLILILPVGALTVPPGELEASRILASQFDFLGGSFGYHNGGQRIGAGSVFLLDPNEFAIPEDADYSIFGFAAHSWELANWESFHVNFAENFFDLSETYEVGNVVVLPGWDFAIGFTVGKVEGISGARFSSTDVQLNDPIIMTGGGFSRELGNPLTWTGNYYAHLANVDAWRYATVQDDEHIIVEFDPFSAYGEGGDSGAPALDAVNHTVVGWNESHFPYSGYGSRTVMGRVTDDFRSAVHDVLGYPPLNPVPEPATAFLFLMGLGGVAFRARRTR